MIVESTNRFLKVDYYAKFPPALIEVKSLFNHTSQWYGAENDVITLMTGLKDDFFRWIHSCIPINMVCTQWTLAPARILANHWRTRFSIISNSIDDEYWNWKCSTAPIQRNLNQANLRIQQQSISNHSIQIIIVVVTPLRVAASCGLFLLANMQRHIALSMDMDPIVCIIKFKSAWESPHSLRPLTKCI